MKIALATDAWLPQVNGVVRTLTETVRQLQHFGHDVIVISPDQFANIPCPGYDEIRLALMPRFGVRKRLTDFAPDIVHIATEGPIGWTARRWCLSREIPFTSAFHTRFPDYLAVRTGLDAKHFWPFMQRFHAPSEAVLAATPSLQTELAMRGISHTKPWSRGIDRQLFRPRIRPHSAIMNLPRPIQLCVGRIAVEKNLEAFLSGRTPGTRVLVGDGPARDKLQREFPEAVFLGALSGAELASAYAAADVFVFPSLTDTFGLVMIEALACGVPVAAFPVPGPLDILGLDGRGAIHRHSHPAGALDGNLDRAVVRALKVRRVDAAVLGQSFSWEASARQFEAALLHALGDDAPLRPVIPASSHRPEVVISAV
ncbi:MAG: glycosyltransferase family 4 protein [Chakrabartia sp.]